MARLSGSFPLKFNDRVIGKAYVVGQDETGLILDIRLDNTNLQDTITELIENDHLPMMSFGFIVEAQSSGFIFEPLKSEGLMQVIEPTEINWEKLRAELAELTQEEKDQAIRNYVQARYARTDKD